MNSGDFETTVDHLNLTRREAKELRQLVVTPQRAENMPQVHIGPILWVKSLLVVALVLVLGGTLGYGIFLISHSESFSLGRRILESATPLIILIVVFTSWNQAAIRGRLVRKLYDDLQTHKRAGTA